MSNTTKYSPCPTYSICGLFEAQWHKLKDTKSIINSSWAGKFITKAIGGCKVALGSPNKLVLEIRAPQGVLKHFFASLAGFNAHKVAAARYCGRQAGGLKSGKLEIFLGEQWWMARAAPLLMNKVCDRNSYILCESLFCSARHPLCQLPRQTFYTQFLAQAVSFPSFHAKETF